MFTREFGAFTREFGVFTREFRAFTREFGVFTREFEDFTREFEDFTRKFEDFTREFVRFFYICSFYSCISCTSFGETAIRVAFILFFFNVPFRLKETKKKDRIPFHIRNPVFFNYKLFCSTVTFCNFIPVYNIPERIDVFRTAVLVV